MPQIEGWASPDILAWPSIILLMASVKTVTAREKGKKGKEGG